MSSTTTALAATCAWLGCDAAPRSNRVCNRHRLRTLRAGQRAAGLSEPRMTPAERLDELEWLLDGGTWVPGAVARLGWTLPSARRAAERAHRTGLSARLRNTETAYTAEKSAA